MTAVALAANAPAEWDRIWSDPAQAEWRKRALAEVYDRIVELVPCESLVVDLGGGVGTLANRLNAERECSAVVWDHSITAAAKAPPGSRQVDIEEWAAEPWGIHVPDGTLFVSTEFFEHVDELTRTRLYDATRDGGLIVSVPNNRLGPDEEPQHTRKWTAKQFLDELREHFGDDCRVEVIGGFLLGVCGELARKPFRLSVTMPVRDEERDIERTLASFRGVADQLVIGVDYRSADRTREIAEQYADDVFTIEDPRGPADDLAPKVHFGHCRNRCLERCNGDWVFMTEGHERLLRGQDELLHLERLPDAVKVAFVMRTGQGMQWGYPWLHRNDPEIYYTRSTHNVLEFPPSYYVVHLPGVATYHERHPDNAKARSKQRRAQNRLSLTDDWVNDGNQNSLMYLGSEWAGYDPERAIARLREFLAVNRNNGPQRYHARLQCARMLAREGNLKDATTVLLGAEADDWSRIEHWFYLGDLAAMQDKHERAIQWYLYASTRIGNPPFSPWWVDLSMYGYLTAQRLVESYAAIGRLDEALHWANRVVELMTGDDADFSDAVIENARDNVDKIRRAMHPENSDAN